MESLLEYLNGSIGFNANLKKALLFILKQSEENSNPLTDYINAGYVFKINKLSSYSARQTVTCEVYKFYTSCDEAPLIVDYAREFLIADNYWFTIDSGKRVNLLFSISENYSDLINVHQEKAFEFKIEIS